MARRRAAGTGAFDPLALSMIRVCAMGVGGRAHQGYGNDYNEIDPFDIMLIRSRSLIAPNVQK